MNTLLVIMIIKLRDNFPQEAIVRIAGDRVTDFYVKEVPKVDSNHTCLAVVSLNIFISRLKLLSTSLFKRV